MTSLRNLSIMIHDTKMHDGPSKRQSLLQDDSTLFHELDESRWSKYDYSEECDSICDEFESRLPGAECDGSVCSLGKSLRERYVPRSVYAEEKEVEAEFPQEVEEPAEHEEPKPLLSGRRGLLVSTKTGRPSLASSNEVTSTSGSVWRSMRAMGFGHDHKEDSGEGSGSVWKSMRAMTLTHATSKDNQGNERNISMKDESESKRTFLLDDSDTHNSSRGEALEQKETPTFAAAATPAPVARRGGLAKSLSFKRSVPAASRSMPRLTRPGLSKPTTNSGDAERGDLTAVQDDGDSDQQEKNELYSVLPSRTNGMKHIRRPQTQDEDEEKKEPTRGMLSRASSFKRASNLKMKRLAPTLDDDTLESEKEVPIPALQRSMKDEKSAPPVVPVEATKRGMLSRATSFKIKRTTLMKDSSNEGTEKEDRMPMLRRATSFKLKKVFSGDAASEPILGLERSTSLKMNQHTTPVA